MLFIAYCTLCVYRYFFVKHMCHFFVDLFLCIQKSFSPKKRKKVLKCSVDVKCEVLFLNLAQNVTLLTCFTMWFDSIKSAMIKLKVNYNNIRCRLLSLPTYNSANEMF